MFPLEWNARKMYCSKNIWEYFFYLRLCKILLKGIALALFFLMDGRVDKAVALHIWYYSSARRNLIMLYPL